MPTSSASRNAPSTVELPSRSENQLRGCAFSTSKVLPNASGLAWRASSRMPRYRTASSCKRRRISMPSAFIISPLQPEQGMAQQRHSSYVAQNEFALNRHGDSDALAHVDRALRRLGTFL